MCSSIAASSLSLWLDCRRDDTATVLGGSGSNPNLAVIARARIGFLRGLPAHPAPAGTRPPRHRGYRPRRVGSPCFEGAHQVKQCPSAGSVILMRTNDGSSFAVANLSRTRSAKISIVKPAREHTGLRTAFGRVGRHHERAAMVAIQGHWCNGRESAAFQKR
jgi:hypothetical protein